MRKIGLSRFSFEETSLPGFKSFNPEDQSLQFTSLAERWRSSPGAGTYGREHKFKICGRTWCGRFAGRPLLREGQHTRNIVE
jgi:hypothetical protein